MPRFAATALVFLSSAAVLVLEILAARLLAPYVGVTLEVYTAIIGVILAGIAVGSWLGGKAADRVEPRGLIGPLLVAGGALSFLSIPLVDGLGAGLRGATAGTTVLLTFFAFFAPAAVLTAVTPAIIKLQLQDLAETGRVVGRLSAVGTAGSIVGTFVTGFLLVAAAPSRPTIRVLAVALILLGVGVAVWLRSSRPLSVGAAVAVVAAAGLSFVAAHPCEQESAYYCARVEEDPDRHGGRILWLDTLRHSYVDLDDPTHLEFAYTAWFGDVATAAFGDGRPVDSLHVGGGGFTMPRYLRATNPGSTSTVLEVDPLLVEVSQTELGLELRDDISVHTGDARTTTGELAEDAYDLIVMDAFGGVSVPWHLATVEYLAELDATLRPDGIYTANVIDQGPRDFLRAYLATTSEVFDHVAVLGHPDAFGAPGPAVGGNYVVIASDAPLPLERIEHVNRNRARVDELLHGPALEQFVGDAPVLHDDHAPVDQLLTPLPQA